MCGKSLHKHLHAPNPTRHLFVSRLLVIVLIVRIGSDHEFGPTLAPHHLRIVMLGGCLGHRQHCHKNPDTEADLSTLLPFGSSDGVLYLSPALEMIEEVPERSTFARLQRTDSDVFSV